MAQTPANEVPAGNAAPPPVHHEAPIHHEAIRVPVRRDVAAHRRASPAATLGGWAIYLIVLAGVAAGLYIAWQGSKNAARGAGLVGGSLLVAALARLVLPSTGPLSSRRKTSDVLAFTAFGAGVLGVALMLP